MLSLCVTLACAASLTYTLLSPATGLDGRATVGTYLDGVLAPGQPWPPAVLSATGAFTNTPARTPHPGLVPYTINSPLWTDDARKERMIALPYDGTPASPKIAFSATGPWIFPAGTVIVKNFDMVMDERPGAVNPIRRLETRILVVDADGSARGATYKWRADYSDADLVPESQSVVERTEQLSIIGADGTPRQQPYLYPSSSECLKCHSASPDDAGKPVIVLGVKTAQLNGNVRYTATDRIDNQLNTWEYLGMFDQPLAEDLSTYGRMVDVGDTSATLEHRFRSYIAANCSHCHRPGGQGLLYDMRIETPLLSPAAPFQPIIAPRNGAGGLIRNNLAASRLFVRDSSTTVPMPPLARNVPDQRIIGPGALYEQWVNYAFDVEAVTTPSRTQVRVVFKSPLDGDTAAQASNYTISGTTVTQAMLDGTDNKVVLLTTPPLAYATNYTLTVNNVREAVAPKNPVWPNSQFAFTSLSSPTAPGKPTISVANAGNAQASLTVIPGGDGGSAITGYTAQCDPGPVTASGTGATVLVTGLINGRAYTCTVAAVNGIGTGPASDPVNVTPFSVPDTPAILQALAGNGSVTLNVSVPNGNGSPVISYTGTCQPGNVTATTAVPPLLVTGLANEIEHTCTVHATNAAGDSAESAGVTVTPSAADPPVLLAVRSIKRHAGTEYPLEIKPVPANPLTVEPRNGIGGHRIVFQFDRPIFKRGTATVVDADGASIGNVTSMPAGANEVEILLTDIPDNQRVTVSLTGVNNVGVASATMGFLVGDANSSGAVNAGDVLVVKARTGTVGNANFLLDFNLSGKIDGADLSMVKARSGLRLP